MNEFMKAADELARENLQTGAGGPFGACIVKDGKIVGKGSNHVLANNDPTAHAEVTAIRDACRNLSTYDLSGCELYTSCFPCPMCMAASVWANIKKVYYGNTKEDAARIGFRDDFIYDLMGKVKDKADVSDIMEMVPLDRDETIKTFEAFDNKADKTIY